jgi:predicted TIM-barrel fold metal-dependent hydrolase
VDQGQEHLGPERAMFESNFPIDKGSCSYAALWNTFKRIAAGCSAAEKAALLAGTTTKFYRWDERAVSQPRIIPAKLLRGMAHGPRSDI